MAAINANLRRLPTHQSRRPLTGRSYQTAEKAGGAIPPDATPIHGD
jgi:hypothetical protein